VRKSAKALQEESGIQCADSEEFENLFLQGKWDDVLAMAKKMDLEKSVDEVL